VAQKRVFGRAPTRSRRVLLAGCLIASCATVAQRRLDERFGPADGTRFDRASIPLTSFRKEVLPLLERRCVVCHGCYDAPCQLKLGSWEGIARGASQDRVYQGERLLEAPTTRLFEDAQQPSAWRRMSFYPVLNERHADPEINRLGSLLYRMLELKRLHPLAKQGVLSSRFDFSVERQQVCPTLAQMDVFEAEHPDWGMPYGLPGLDAGERDLVARWLEGGAGDEGLAPLPLAVQPEIETWEAFFAGGDSFKQQLVSRYLYEHLFLAVLHFESDPEQSRFRLVRSSTPPGQPIHVIPTRRPYDAPGTRRVYYRLDRIRESNVEKTDMPYTLGPARLARLKAIFFGPSYEVTTLPSYAPDVGSNPFVAFAAIPARSRYRFMLDEAQLTLMGFIKGPVCRGQLALNAIEDQFWVFFADPDGDPRDLQDRFLKKEARNLGLPAAWGSSSPIVIPWLEYKHRQDAYMMDKSHFLEKELAPPKIDVSLIWNGDGVNPNAALTVFRHFDSATVVQGLVGPEPKTVWVLTYAELERIQLPAGGRLRCLWQHRPSPEHASLHGLFADGGRVQLSGAVAARQPGTSARPVVPGRQPGGEGARLWRGGSPRSRHRHRLSDLGPEARAAGDARQAGCAAPSPGCGPDTGHHVSRAL
jgi:hypothetical protein